MKIHFKIDDNGCWLWQGEINRNGYGRVYVGGRRLMAHRVMFETVHGVPIAKGLHLDHLCSNRSCVNPAHLEPVTCAENNRRHSGTKLSAIAVRIIRASEATDSTLAEQFNVGRTTIAEVRRGISWSDEGTYAERRAGATA